MITLEEEKVSKIKLKNEIAWLLEHKLMQYIVFHPLSQVHIFIKYLQMAKRAWQPTWL